MIDIDLEEYNYQLTPEKIAQYPLEERDNSKLLVYNKGIITDAFFNQLHNHIPGESLLIFNNTRVVRARIFFRKESGAEIEVFCLEPVSPADYALSFSSKNQVEWKCLVGNRKKWKKGTVSTVFTRNDRKYRLTAEIIAPSGDAWQIKFTWDADDLSFGDVIESAGKIPLPPYISRGADENDDERYQTVYSLVRGSVAAPTAGLHFTGEVLKKIQNNGCSLAELTLHVGAGTFQPVKSDNILKHEMHTEHFFISIETISKIIKSYGKITCVGTTSVRALESLYWLGLKAFRDPDINASDMQIGQWEAYQMNDQLTSCEALETLILWMNRRNLAYLHVATRIIIVPGYRFRMINGLITNFHLPRSTLLLLISAWIGEDWKKIYNYALENNYRFLSYGDSSILYR